MFKQKKINWLLFSVMAWCSFGNLFCSNGIDVSRAIAGELQPLYPGYPEVFDVSGVIDFITDEGIVLNDSLYPFSPSIKFHNSHGVISKENFNIGVRIGIIMDDNHTIKSVWLIKKGEKQKKQGMIKQKEPSSTPIHLEDGVWKN